LAGSTGKNNSIMPKKQTEPTNPPQEKAFLVGVEFHNHPQPLFSLQDSLSELALLADTAGLVVVGEISQKLDRPNPDTLIGSGKIEEVKTLAEESDTQVVIFDTELSPRHLREIEEKLGSSIKVIDRTALILDIFAQHAHTREGILQVELAQYEYRLPRLTRAWTHLSRQTGGAAGRSGSAGGVGLRGPGETQLEVDQREIRKRITRLKSELQKIRAHRMRYRAQRQRSLIPTVALVGYTNAGKSTLLNYLAKAKVYVADQLFATLDPTTRRVTLPAGNVVLFTDTVGFIQKLPTQLVAAFRATLEEITDADLLLHIIDSSHPNAIAHATTVQATLTEIGAGHIPTILALNKIDRFPNPEKVREIISTEFDHAIAISAITGEGIFDLLKAIEAELFENYQEIQVKIPFQHGDLISLFHEQGQVQRIEHERGGVLMRGAIPGRLLARFSSFLLKNDPSRNEDVNVQ